MGVTKSLDGGAVWGANLIKTTTVVEASYAGGASALSNYPVSNLLNPLRTKTARFNYDSGASTSVSIYLTFAEAVAIDKLAIAFVDTNIIQQSKHIYVKAMASAASETCQWPVYTYVGDNGVQRYYLDTPDDGTAPATTTEMKIVFGGNALATSDGYLEIGEIVLATYIDVDISTPFARTLVNPSVYATSYGGQEYADEKNMFNNIGVNTTPMNSTEMYTLQESIKQIGSAHTILDIHASDAGIGDTALSTQGTLNLASTYYGRLKKGIKASIKGFNNAGLGLSFGEARK